MTRNQILYQQHLETKRANQAQEALTHRRDEANIVQQERNWLETKRHNVTGEAELSRHNIAVESETARHNQAVENQSYVSLGIQQHQADTARMNALTNRGQLLVSEGQLGVQQGRLIIEQQQANTQKRIAEETHRSNLERERIQQEQTAIQQQQADTQARTSAATIDLQSSQASKLDTETSYLGQDNTRKWISTGINLVGGIANVGETASDIFRNATQGALNVAKSVPVFTSLFG